MLKIGLKLVNKVKFVTLLKTTIMTDKIYHVRIKKEYANDAMAKLQQEDAIEILADIPEWQKKETLKRLEAYKNNPENIVSEEEILSILNEVE